MNWPWTPKDKLASGLLQSDVSLPPYSVDGKDSAAVPFAQPVEPIKPDALVKLANLGYWDKRKAVNMTLEAAILALHHSWNVNYTQGGSRWEAIERGYKAWRGQYPHWADCSSFVTWCLWNGLDHFHMPDVVNHQNWRGGYTRTMLMSGWRVSSPLPGDAVIYGSGWPGEHTALYTGGGLVVSHGGPGVHLLPMRYRNDVLAIRRYI